METQFIKCYIDEYGVNRIKIKYILIDIKYASSEYSDKFYDSHSGSIFNEQRYRSMRQGICSCYFPLANWKIVGGKFAVLFPENYYDRRKIPRGRSIDSIRSIEIVEILEILKIDYKDKSINKCINDLCSL